MFSEDYARDTTALGSVQKVMRDDLTDSELASLARSGELKIRAAVAEHSQTPLTSLVKLASDEAPGVRAAVARNSRVDIPLEVRETLARDKSLEVLFALVKCESVPGSILSKLARSTNREVAAAAKDRMKRKPIAGAVVSAIGQVGFASS